MTDTGQAAPAIPDHDLVRLIRSGGYADVYEYRQRKLDLSVAVKVLRDNGLTDKERDEFTTEAHTMARLAEHPHVVPITSVDVAEDGRPYLIMKYYPGDNLAVHAARGRLGVPEVLRIGVQIACAVESAHRAAILHRDIKPSNILLDAYGRPALTDFGIASSTVTLPEDASGANQALSVPWSPPELVFDTGVPDVRSDVYSLGASVWQLLVGRSPFELPGSSADNSIRAIMERIRDTPPPTVGRADIPEQLDRLLRRMMAKSPGQRPPSALAVAKAFNDVERALRLPLTELVLLERADTGTQAAPPEDVAPVTRIRPTTVTPDAPPVAAPTTQRAVVPSYDNGTPPSPTVSSRVASPPNLTVRRSITPASTAQAAEPPTPVRRRGLLLTAGAVVLAVAVGGVVLFTAHGGAAPPTPARSDPAVDQDAGQLGDNVPPGVPVVVVRRTTRTAVRASWSYSAPYGSDTFVWRTQDGTRSGTTRKPVLELSVPAGARVCLQVKVVRADGSYANADWSPAGCVT